MRAGLIVAIVVVALIVLAALLVVGRRAPARRLYAGQPRRSSPTSFNERSGR
jgi:hypothetical protein